MTTLSSLSSSSLSSVSPVSGKTSSKRLARGGAWVVLLGLASLAATCQVRMDFHRASDQDPELPQACFQIDYPCASPRWVTIEVERDGEYVEVAHHERVRPDGAEIGDAPGTMCVDTSDQPDGLYTYRTRASCGRVLGWGLLHDVPTISAGRRVMSLSSDQQVYMDGDEIEVIAESAAEDLTLVVDASQLPVELFGPGILDPIPMVHRGGGVYRAVLGTLQLPTGGPSRAGVYTAVVNHLKSKGSGVVERLELPIELLPAGPSRVHVAGGSDLSGFFVQESDSDPATVEILSARAIGGYVWPQADPDPSPPRLQFSKGTSIASSGQQVEVDLRTDGPGPFRLAVFDDERDGASLVTIPEEGSCSGSTCTRHLDLWISNIGDTAGTPLSIPLTLQAYGGGAASPPHALDLDIAAPPFPPTHAVRGWLRYEVDRFVVDLADELESSPQYYGSKSQEQNRPIARALVWIRDACGTLYKQFTNDWGYFSLEFATACPDEPAEITAFAVRDWTPERVAVARWTGGNIDEYDELTADPDDYTVYGFEVGSFVPADGPWPAGQNLGWVTLQKDEENQALLIMDTIARAMDHFGEWVDDGDFHDMNIEWDPDRPLNDDYNVYLPAIHPSLIHVHQHSGGSEFAVAHEASHYFQKQFLIGGLGGYGRFAEPAANAHAAAILQTPFFIPYEGSQAESLDVNGKYESDTFTQAAIDFSLNCPDGDLGNPCSHSQGWDWRIYYDLLDHTAASNPEPLAWVETSVGSGVLVPVLDEIDGGGGPGAANGGVDNDLMDVMVNYLGANPPNPAYVDRGMPGKDLVDVLDGFVCRGHLNPVNGGNLLQITMGYDYDFAPPNMNCP